MAVMTSFLSLLEPLTEPEHVRPSPPTTINGGGAEGEAHEVADRLLAQARQALAEAEETRRRAAHDTEEMREDARIQAEAFREGAWQEGFHEGKQTAHSQIETQLRAQWEAEREGFRAQMQTLTDGFVEARQALWESQEAEMVGFVLDITRQVIKTEVTQNPEIVAHVLRNALRRVTDKENVRIRVSTGDAPLVREMRDDLMSLLDGVKNLEILDDRRIGDGGCVVETNAGTIDAKIETQLAEVERALSHALEG